MGFPIEIEIRDDLSVALRAAREASEDLTPAMRDIAGHLAGTTMERFEDQRSPAGVPWKPSRRAIKEGGRTLTLSGDLVGSIREDYGPDYAAAGPEASGGAAVYAGVHQRGATIVPRRARALSFAGRIVSKVVIPKREYLGFNEENTDYALAALADHIGRAAAGAAS